MSFLIPFLPFIFYINLNNAIDDIFFLNSSEITDITILERGILLFTPPEQKATDHGAIQIVIFAGCTILVVLIGLLLCSICCKHYRRDHAQITRSPSINSIQELIRERLLDRPPTYYESQANLNMNQTDDPPGYNEILPNTNSGVPQSVIEIPITSPVYTISSKMSISYANSALDLTYTECESDTDSPPSYHVSEGVVNPVLLNVTNNSSITNEHHLQIEDQNISSRSELYI